MVGCLLGKYIKTHDLLLVGCVFFGSQTSIGFRCERSWCPRHLFEASDELLRLTVAFLLNSFADKDEVRRRFRELVLRSGASTNIKRPEEFAGEVRRTPRKKKQFGDAKID